MLENLVISIVLGTISGIISGTIVYSLSQGIEKRRKIIDYAERTAEHACIITFLAEKYVVKKDLDFLELLLEKTIRRGFIGDIRDGTEESEKLQNAIANCNSGISQIQNAIEGNNIESDLVIAIGDMSEKLVDIWNATVDYRSFEKMFTRPIKGLAYKLIDRCC